MGITAENLSDKYGITREQCDEYALQSQKRWKEGERIRVEARLDR